MKESWEIKKLGDCCNIQTGKLDANARVENGKYPFYTCDSQPYRIDTYAFDAEAILISGNGSLVGHVNYYKGKFNAYQRTYVLTEFSSFYIPYLIHFLKKYIRPYIMKNKKGGCIPYITLPILKNFLIPCPPLPEQESIVAELDCLAGAIEKQKQQLKELDNLAQAIFYDMFGDPITNEKGWDIKKLEKLCDILDAQRKPVTKKDRREGCYPYYGATGIQDYVDSYIFDGRYLLVGEDGAKWGALDKTAFIIEGKCWVNNHAHILKINNLAKDTYLEYYLTVRDLNEYITGAIVPKLTQQALRNIAIPTPPMDLQTEFAAKIVEIEKQKELIKQSLSETEKLFSSRMDYYFN